MDLRIAILFLSLWVNRCICVQFVNRCLRVPLGLTHAKTPGDNGIEIRVSGSPEKYIPGLEYTITLGVQRRGMYSMKHFTQFMLVVQPSNKPLEYELKKTGMFTPFRDEMTKFTSHCPNAIVEASIAPKHEINVLWTAPPPDSGCITFQATLLEDLTTWYMDDDGLSVELCEEDDEGVDDQSPVLPECCACEEATYELAFEGLWKRQTHPKDFPSNPWITYFTDLTGASHSVDFSFWEYGGIASEGLRHIAEMESSDRLEAELKARGKDIRTIILARGLPPLNLNGMTKTTFRVDKKNHLMSFVSKLSPSPDWVVGVSKLELCQKNCSWLTEKVLNLYPWDVGTDSGITYSISSKQPTVPREKIRLITASYPNNENSPFYDPDGEPMKPVARLTITRQRVYDMSCPQEYHRPTDDHSIGIYPPFGTGENNNGGDSWSGSSISNEICMQEVAKGPCRIQEDRWYYDSRKGRCYQFVYGGCDGNENNFQSLEECQQTCYRQDPSGTDGTHPDETEGIERNENAHVPYYHGGRGERMDCKVSEWTDWSQCSVTCGKGKVEKTRFIIQENSYGGRECPPKSDLRKRRNCRQQPCDKHHHQASEDTGYDQPESYTSLREEQEIRAQRFYDETDDEFPPSQHARRKGMHILHSERINP